MAEKTLLLGIDVGTSSAKAVLIDTAGLVLGAASHDHPTHSPAAGFQEQDAPDWWHGTCRSIRQVLAETGADNGSIAGLSLSGQGCACLPVDADGEPLGRASIWTDARAGKQQKYIRTVFDGDPGPVAGNNIYDQPEPRMLWLREHAPDVYERTACFLSTVSYLTFRLTGEFHANYSDWGFHLSLDRATKSWNEDFLKGIGLTSEKFPRLFAPHEVVGYVTDQAAAECGLKAGTPVVAGGQDSTVSALAVGSLEAGQSVYMRGTTDLLSFCTDKPDYHPDLYTTCAVLPGLYMSYDMKEVIGAGGANKWLARMLFNEAYAERFEEMNRLAEATPAGCNGVIFLPYILMSTTHDPAKERAGQLFGLTINTARGELCRAIMEGTAYAIRESIERIAQAGITTVDLRPTGGPTKSTLWNQITADVTGLPALLPAVSAGAAYGAALLAGFGVGVYPLDDDYAALRAVIKLRERHDPQHDDQTVYDRTYAAFIQLAETTSGIAPALRGDTP